MGLGVEGVGASGGWGVSLVEGGGGYGVAVEVGAEVFVGGAGEVVPEVFAGGASGEVGAEETFDGGWGVFGGGSEA